MSQEVFENVRKMKGEDTRSIKTPNSPLLQSPLLIPLSHPSDSKTNKGKRIRNEKGEKEGERQGSGSSNSIPPQEPSPPTKSTIIYGDLVISLHNLQLAATAFNSNKVHQIFRIAKLTFNQLPDSPTFRNMISKIFEHSNITSTLTGFVMDNCGYCFPENLTPFLMAFNNNPQLEVLSLTFSRLQNISGLLQPLCHIRHLDLTGSVLNNVHDELIASLQQMDLLKTLTMKFCSLNGSKIVAILQALKSKGNLERIDFEGNSLSVFVVNDLGKIISNMRGLKHMGLANLRMSISGLHTLLPYLFQSTPHLETLLLHGNVKDFHLEADAIFKQIRILLDHCAKLETISFDFMLIENESVFGFLKEVNNIPKKAQSLTKLQGFSLGQKEEILVALAQPCWHNLCQIAFQI